MYTVVKFFIIISIWMNLVSSENESNNYLIFGGNGFIGAEAVVRLLAEKVGNIYLVNRGNWYWDSNKRISSSAQLIKCDRNYPLETCPAFVSLIEKVLYFDFVIDFSLYSKKGFEAVLPVLKDRIGLYIYISSVDIYQMCSKNHTGFTKETDDVRVKFTVSDGQLDSYAHNKLEAEEALQKQRSQGGFPYVFLRLPDVFGPRDTTRRWWLYQLWMELHPHIKRNIFLAQGWKGFLLRPIYVNDVAESIIGVIKAGETVHDEIFNIAMEEVITTEQMFEDIETQLGIPHLIYDTLESDLAFQIFPKTIERDNLDMNYNILFTSTVTGPMDIEKAKKLLHFKPTPWKIALKETVTFYLEAFYEFPKERNSVINLLMNIIPNDNREYFNKFIKDAISVEKSQVGNIKDEF